MQRRRITCTVMLVAILLSGCSPERRDGHEPAAHSSDTAHWDYGSRNGPAHWGELNPDFSLCSKGLEQSPVNLSGAPASEHPEFSIDYLPATLKIIRHEHVVDIIDNGHTIQVNYDEGSTITAGDTVYELMQYHFHAPSEHTIDSRHSPMEMHLVHQSPSGQLVVVGVLIEEGEHNPAFEPVWRNLPHEAGEARHLEHVTVNVRRPAAQGKVSLQLPGVPHDSTLQRGSEMVRRRRSHPTVRKSDPGVHRDLPGQQSAGSAFE